MDIGFEFLLPIESKVTTIKFEQPFYEWQGEKFPQGEEEAWFHYFKLIKSNVPEHIISLLPNNLKKERWQCISIIDGIESLMNELSVDKDISEENNILLNLIHSLTNSQKQWVMIFQPVICAYTDSDIEGYYLIIAQKSKVISSLKIAEMDGETINAFIISKDYEIQFYTKKNSDDPKVLKNKYKIQKDASVK